MVTAVKSGLSQNPMSNGITAQYRRAALTQGPETVSARPGPSIFFRPFRELARPLSTALARTAMSGLCAAGAAEHTRQSRAIVDQYHRWFSGYRPLQVVESPRPIQLCMCNAFH